MRIERVTPPAPPTAAMAEAVRATAARGNRVSLAEALAAARARQTILGTSLAARMTPTRVPEPVMPAVGSIGPEAGSSATVTVAEASVDEAPVAGATSDGPSVAGGLSADTPVVTPPPIDKTSETVLYASSADTLLRTFDIHDFSYLAVQNGEAAVPRVFVKAFPADIAEIDRVDLRKRLFLDSMLPIVLAANEAILADRQRLKTLRGNIAAGHPPSRAEARWLARLAARYEVAAQDLDTLLARVDVVPSSMALAQAAVESGWGTSSLARRGNALFGQIVADPTDGIPASDGDHGYAAFDSLSDSVASYARNLNTHPAYQDFRALRARMRAAGEPLDGHALMGTLDAYSERGQDYIAYVRRLMRANDLQLFDRVRLDGGGLAPRWPRLTADRT
ncbi:MAG: glucosaminidase domain-containing protein [Azospirillaceae bacterium]